MLVPQCGAEDFDLATSPAKSKRPNLCVLPSGLSLRAEDCASSEGSERLVRLSTGNGPQTRDTDSCSFTTGAAFNWGFEQKSVKTLTH